MKTIRKYLTLFTFALLLSSTQSFADWVVTPDPFGGNTYKVKNTETGQTVSTSFKKKKNAKKAAKALNKGSKGVRDLHEPGCNEPGVVC